MRFRITRLIHTTILYLIDRHDDDDHSDGENDNDDDNRYIYLDLRAINRHRFLFSKQVLHESRQQVWEEMYSESKKLSIYIYLDEDIDVIQRQHVRIEDRILMNRDLVPMLSFSLSFDVKSICQTYRKYKTFPCNGQLLGPWAIKDLCLLRIEDKSTFPLTIRRIVDDRFRYGSFIIGKIGTSMLQQIRQWSDTVIHIPKVSDVMQTIMTPQVVPRIRIQSCYAQIDTVSKQNAIDILFLFDWNRLTTQPEHISILREICMLTGNRTDLDPLYLYCQTDIQGTFRWSCPESWPYQHCVQCRTYADIDNVDLYDLWKSIHK